MGGLDSGGWTQSRMRSTTTHAIVRVEYHPLKLIHKEYMSTFAEQLKNEIARIARKESRADSKQVKKASTQYRAEIAALKRRLTSLESSLGRLLKQQVPAKTQEKQKQRFLCALEPMALHHCARS